MKDVDQTAQVDAGHLTDSPHGDTVEVVHDGELRGYMVTVEASGKDRRLRLELPVTVRAYRVVEAVKDLLRFPGSIVYYRPVRFLCRDEGTPALGTAIACIPVDDEIGGLIRNGGSAVSGMAKNRPSLFVCLLFGGSLFKGYLR